MKLTYFEKCVFKFLINLGDLLGFVEYKYVFDYSISVSYILVLIYYTQLSDFRIYNYEGFPVLSYETRLLNPFFYFHEHENE